MKRHVLLSVLVAGTFAFGASALAQKDGATGAQPKTKEAAKSDEAKAKLGEKAPDFTLTDIDGKTWNLAELTKQKKIVVLEWFNPDCPYSGAKHYDNAQTMNDTAAKFKDKGVVWISVNSGTDKAGGSKERNEQARKDWNIKHPIALDKTGEVGRAYGAKQTPTCYIINADGVLVYWGGIDNDKTAEKVGAVNYVSKALEEVVAGQTVTQAKTDAYGCRVHYAAADKAKKDDHKDHDHKDKK